MTRRRFLAAAALGAATFLALGVWSASPTSAEGRARLSVAVTSADVEAIVRRVGGGEVETFNLFKGCVLRKDLLVESGAMESLAGADAVVWSGLFHESSAIHASIEKLPPARREKLGRPQWIDVSRDAVRINVPTSSCEGYVEIQFMHGDPFFWLNPRNGRTIANNVAEGLARLRPERRELFLANADRFSRDLDADIARWEPELRALSGLKVFATQCGWQNFAQLGGPTFITCRREPGTLVPPDVLAAQINSQPVDLILVDPNTPPEYAETFGRKTKVKVVMAPSSVADLPGATSYSSVFDNVIKVLKSSAPPK